MRNATWKSAATRRRVGSLGKERDVLRRSFSQPHLGDNGVWASTGIAVDDHNRKVEINVVSSLPDLFRAAHAEYEAGRLAQAEHGFLRLLLACPGHPGALYYVGAIAYQQTRYAVAANYFSQAVAGNPAEATFHSGLGAAYQALGRLAEALLCHQQARALDPESSSVLNNLGIFEFRHP